MSQCVLFLEIQQSTLQLKDVAALATCTGARGITPVQVAGGKLKLAERDETPNLFTVLKEIMMSTKTSSMSSLPKREFSIARSPRLSGSSRKIAVSLWLLITVLSGMSWVLSLYALYLWDRVPAAEAPLYFPEMTSEGVQAHTNWQSTVFQAGFSLAGYSLYFLIARLIAGLALFLVSFWLIFRYHDHLMALLMAILLSLFAAAGIWGNTLFGWAVEIAPWINYPSQLLSWLLWCGAIVPFTFPDGKFTPGWTVWLAALLIPLTFLSAFGIDIFLNPANWPAPFYLLPNLFFIGGALLAVIYRYARTASSEQKQRLRWYTIGLSLLVGIYFANLFLTDIYYMLAGRSLFNDNAAALIYVLLNEPVWFACETFFVVGLALSVFRDRLLEGELQ